MKLDLEQLHKLIQAHLDQRLSDQEYEMLQTCLEEDPDARASYVKLARLDSLLHDSSAAAEVDAVDFSPVSRKASGFIWWAMAAAAIAILLALTVLLKTQSSSEYKEVPRRVAARGVAVITAEAEAVWDREQLTVGVALEPGRLVLRQGLAQIDFFGGASISLSGPAELELVNKDAAILRRGKLKADVPPAARGFEVRSSDVLLEDLGTSFGLSVGEDRKTDLIVFDGEVRATGKNGKPLLLFGGDSARLESGSAIPQSAGNVDGIPDISDVIAGSSTREELRYAAWKEASLERRRDPRLIAYYDFENLTAATRRLRNRGLHGDGSELDGGIVGARVAEGRWRNKTALDFRAEGDRVRFDIPGEWDALTLYAWVRIDALDRHLNSLFLTDYFDENEIHWQLSHSGHLHFAASPMGVVDIPKHNRRYLSEEFWDPSRSGQWLFLAVTAEKGVGKVKHYVNGEVLPIAGGTQRHKPLPAMRIGEADLGNWSDPIWENVIRTLNGRIDEFAIYGVALDAKEIAGIYEEGRL